MVYFPSPKCYRMLKSCSRQREDGALVTLVAEMLSSIDFASSCLIDDLKSEYSAKDDVALVYFYLDGSDYQPLDVATLYRTFVHQLVLQVPGVPRDLNLRSRYRNKDDLDAQKEWRRLYKSLGQSFSRLFIVLDASDECQEFIDLSDMMELLIELLKTEN